MDQHCRGSDKQVEQQRSASAGAARVLVDLPARYLDANGAIKADPGIDRKLVEFATAVAALATRAAAGKRPGHVECRAHGRQVACRGEIETGIAQLRRRFE